jgi:hypothetical protein
MRNTSLAIGGVAAGLVLLAACGQAGTSGSTAATSSANAAGSGGTANTVSMAQLDSMVSTNVAQQNTAHATMQLSGAVDASGTAQLKFGSQPAVDEQLQVPVLGSTEFVVSNGTGYMKVPPKLAQVASQFAHVTTPWVKIDPNGTSPVDKALASDVQLIEQNSDPVAMIDKIKSAGTITSTNSEQVAGQQTTHYTIKVDLQKLVASMNASDSQKSLLNQAVKDGVTMQDFNLWVNSNNLPVQIKTALDIPKPSDRTQSLQVDTTVNYSDWGQPVTITVPPADQVSTLSS